MVIVDALDQFICILQGKAGEFADGYMYSVNCGDADTCRLYGVLLAKRLTSAADCDDNTNRDIVDGYVDGEIEKIIQDGSGDSPFSDPVESDCTLTFTDITPSVTCAATTFTVLL